jgi:SAM-dependent methyltransferase
MRAVTPGSRRRLRVADLAEANLRTVATQRSAGRRFDREYGVTTHAVLFLSDLDPDAAGDAAAHATHYEAVPVGDFRALIAQLPRDARTGATFVDIGAGMGRALLLAAEYPFKQVVGVEVSPGLYEVAKENLERANDAKRRCRDLRVVRADARLWNYPPGDVVAFLYNPFDGPALEATLAALLGRRDPGATWLLYHTAVERALVERDATWKAVADLGFGAVYHALPRTSRSFCE